MVTLMTRLNSSLVLWPFLVSVRFRWATAPTVLMRRGRAGLGLQPCARVRVRWATTPARPCTHAEATLGTGQAGCSNQTTGRPRPHRVGDPPTLARLLQLQSDPPYRPAANLPPAPPRSTTTIAPRSRAVAAKFRFFDKAAILAPSTGEKGTATATSPWRLCTPSQVEELKMLLRMLPVWASMVLFFAATAQMSSTLIEQGTAMDNRVGRFTVPPASLATFDVISVMVCIPVYDAVLVPLARRATGKDRGLSHLQRIGVGLALSAAGMAYAAVLEARRLALARAGAAGMSIMWQAPAFAVLGAGEVFASIGILEFFYDESPDGMKSLGNAFAQLAIAAGSYFNSAVLGAVAAATARGGEPGWIPEDLNQGHLDYFFWMMAALCLVNLIQFAHCSVRYRGKTIC